MGSCIGKKSQIYFKMHKKSDECLDFIFEPRLKRCKVHIVDWYWKPPRKAIFTPISKYEGGFENIPLN